MATLQKDQETIFIVKNNTVISPEGRNMLGISRDYVMNELCKQLKIKVIEKNIEPYDVYDADEAFISGRHFVFYQSQLMLK